MILGIPKPVSVSFAANGIGRSKRDYLGLPLKREELLEAAKAAQNAGASLFSFSVRDEKGLYCVDPDICSEVVMALRDALDGAMVLQLELDASSGASPAQFGALLSKAQPDACQIPLNQILPRDGDEADEEAARDLFDLCDQLKIGVQIAINQATDIDWFYAFRQYGIIPETCQSLLFILGSDGEDPSSEPHRLRGFLAGMEKQNLLGKIAWSVAAFGPQETAALTAAMALGGHIAPGSAYNIHTVEGEPFLSPQDQLTALGDLAGRLGRPTASAFETRTLLFGAR